jgi:AraC-like DNA-binding protein
VNKSLDKRVSRWWADDRSLGASSKSQFRTSVASLPHTHSEYALIICLAGRMQFVLDGEPQSLEPGEMLVHNPGQVHQSLYGTSQASCDSATLYFSREAMLTLFKRIALHCDNGEKDILFLGKMRDTKVIQLTEDLVKEWQTKDIGHEIMMQSLVIQILVYLFRYCLSPTIVGSSGNAHKHLPIWEMSRAMEYMEVRGKKDFNTVELCRTVGTSQSRLVPLFKNSTGLNPRVYFDWVLVQRAQQFLQTQNCSVKEVAYELGFQDVSHFCKVFRSIAGVSPMTYRESPSQALLDITKKCPSILAVQSRRSLSQLKDTESGKRKTSGKSKGR